MEHAETEAEHAEYPWRSPCGPELNFIKAADPHAALVFQQLVRRGGGHAGEGAGDAGEGAGDAGDASSSGGGAWALTYGSPSSETLWVPFDPASLRMSAGTGRLFHGAAGTRCGGGVGLVKSHLALELSERIVPMTEQEQGAAEAARAVAAAAGAAATLSEEQVASDPAAAASGFCFEWPDEGSGGGIGRWPIHLLP